MKSLRNKECLYQQKSINSIKITVRTVIELAYKVFDHP